MDAALVQKMEGLMNEVAKMQRVVAQRSEEIARLTLESEKRKAAVPASDESDAVQMLRQEIAARQDDLARMRSTVEQKEHENTQYVEMLQRERQQQELYGPGDRHEVVQIRERRQQNDELHAEVRQLMAKLSLLTVQQRDVEKSLEEKEHQAIEAKRRTEQNARTEMEFSAQLQDLGQLKERHQNREEELIELSQIIEEMDVSLQQVAEATHSLDLDRQSDASNFERSPLLGVWLGTTAAALATMNIVKYNTSRDEQWVTSRQQEQARLEITKRVAEIAAVKQRLNERKQQMRQLVESAQANLDRAIQQRELVRADRDELQRTLDGDQAVLISNLQAQIPMLEHERVAKEREEAHAKSEWDKVEEQATAKYAQAEAVLDKQMKLLEWEEEHTREIYDRTRTQLEEEKQQLLARLQERPVENHGTEPAR